MLWHRVPDGGGNIQIRSTCGAIVAKVGIYGSSKDDVWSELSAGIDWLIYFHNASQERSVVDLKPPFNPVGTSKDARSHA